MRIILTSATVAILLRNGSNVSSASTVSSTRILTVSQGRDDKTQLEYSKNESFQKKRVVQDRFSMSKSGDECNSFVSNEEKTGESNLEPDIGILSCSLSNQECLRDTTSSIGGRCFDRRPRDTSQVIESPIFRRRHRAMEKETSTLHTTVNHVHQTPRFLQDEKFACQANCPEDFCNCARNNYYGAKCANEMNDVCVAELLPECVPTDYVYYYEETYCKFASCIISERNYWDCECEAYRNYCNLYYMYAESQAACEVADCCDNTKEGDDRASCIPITFAPTATPDSDSGMTSMPTDSPSVVKDSAIPSSLPSTSEPSNSSTTASPSKSPLALPFTSSSTLPSSSPSLTPSILLASSPPSSVPSSADPSYSPTTGTPTKSPSALPTFFPLFLPTSALPSASLESNRPTEAPTISVTSTNSPFPSVETFLSTSLPESSSFTPSTPPTFHPTGSSYTTEQTESNAASTPRAPTKSPIKESTQSRTEAKSTEVPSQPPDEDSDGLLFPPTTEIDVNSSQFTYGSYAWIATFCTSFGGTMLLLSW